MRFTFFFALLAFLLTTTFSFACDDSSKVFKVCRDQKGALAEALEAAKRDKKLLVVSVGAEWCPWCHSMHGILGSPEFSKNTAGKFAVTDLALFQEREKLPSGLSAMNQLLQMAGGKDKFKGIPMLFVANPVSGQARYIDTEKLEKNTATTKGHDTQKVYAAVLQAAKELE
jgi:thiol-disulfide isomerase/thioredoxin